MLTEKSKKIWSLIGKNTASFAFCMGCIYLFMFLFGNANTLVSVAIVVGLMSLPLIDPQVNHKQMALTVFLLFLLSGLGALLSLVNIGLSIFCNFTVIIVIMIFTLEPQKLKPYMPFLLCYIFSQGSPVAGHDLTLRILALTAGGAAVALISYFTWQHKLKDAPARPMREQIRISAKHKSFILRLAIGLVIASIIGFIFHLKKPMWISIVVMSLTQIDLQQTHERIKYRIIASIAGIFFFLLFCQLLVPQEYLFIFIIFLGYLSSWVKEYKYAQVINTISAINANLVLFDVGTAIETRLLLLGIGIAIVLILFLLERATKHFLQQHKINNYHKPPAAA
ncbi:MAG: FUSC family protein [Christensenella sp.]